MSLISVIIPARDDAEYLRACLAALAVQTRPADEIVVVDNASSDTTAEIARDAGARVVFEPLWGIPAAAAAGFDAANGDILCRLDADSLPPPDWLHRMEAHLTGEGAAAVVTGPGEFYGAGPVARWLGTRVYVPTYFRSMGLVLGHPPVFGSNFAMRAEVWAVVRHKVHRTVRNVHDDLDLSIQLEPDVAIVYDPALVVGISARPLDTFGGLIRRMWWVLPTLLRSWREESLLRRRSRWRRAARRQA
jgi:glycosyltransferase involved in cell wall biosynthesis